METLGDGLSVADEHRVGVGEELSVEDCEMDSVAVADCVTEAD